MRLRTAIVISLCALTGAIALTPQNIPTGKKGVEHCLDIMSGDYLDACLEQVDDPDFEWSDVDWSDIR